MKSTDYIFPLTLLGVCIFGAWVAAMAPLPTNAVEFLQKWQTSIAAIVALSAAWIAHKNTSRTLQQNNELERQRRGGKQASSRATLPLALSQVTKYSLDTAKWLNALVSASSDGVYPCDHPNVDGPEPLDEKVIGRLCEIIEYSDGIDVRLVEYLIAWVQIVDDRTRALGQRRGSIGIYEINGYIIDSMLLNACAASLYRYGRRQEATMPADISWNEVRRALLLLEDRINKPEDLHEIINMREKVNSSPFASLDGKAPWR